VLVGFYGCGTAPVIERYEELFGFIIQTQQRRPCLAVFVLLWLQQPKVCEQLENFIL
jgi:hypothetical protein